jgi:hypothetical protein
MPATTDMPAAGAGGKPSKIAATFVSGGAIQAARVGVAMEGSNIALDITTASGDHHLIFEPAAGLDLVLRVTDAVVRAMRVEDNAG